MNFRYDFANKLDLSKFRKQAIHYSSTQLVNCWEFYLPLHKVEFSTELLQRNFFEFKVKIFKLTKDELGDVIQIDKIYPNSDSLFEESECFHIYFNVKSKYADEGELLTGDVEYAVDSFINILKYLSKINRLKAFL